VLVLGTKFGGLTAALAVHHELRGDVDVTVVANDDRFLFNPGLIWLPFGKRDRADITFPAPRPSRIMASRVTGDRDFRTAKAGNAGLMRRAEAAVVHAVLDVAVVDGELFVLMADVGDRLVPPGDAPVDLALHRTSCNVRRVAGHGRPGADG
jgi:hypothetical protein